MEYKQIQELIKAVNKTGLTELSIKDGDFEITIKQELGGGDTQYVAMPQMPMQQMMSPMAPPVAVEENSSVPVAASNAITVKSPMIGTFYRSSGPEKGPFVGVGDTIEVGQVVCIIEAMKLFNEIESEVSGRIVKVLADDAGPVEYDQPLFMVEPI